MYIKNVNQQRRLYDLYEPKFSINAYVYHLFFRPSASRSIHSNSRFAASLLVNRYTHTHDTLNEIAYYDNYMCDDEEDEIYDNMMNNYKNKIIINGGKEMNNLSKTVVDMMKKEVVEFITSELKNKFGVERMFHFTPHQYYVFLYWLKKYDINFKNHIIKGYTNGYSYKYLLRDIDIIIKIDKNTFCRVTSGKKIENKLSDIEKLRYLNAIGDVKIYSFGRNCHKVIKELISIENSKDTLNCYKVSARKENSDMKIFLEELNKRDSHTVFLDGENEDKLFKHIDKFINNKNIYKKRNLIYKTGILLYGLPGTGKTSIANMICTKYNINMILINMSEFCNIDIESLTSSINADNEQYVILMEDIDCVIGDREKEDNKDAKNINKLLQFLDSTSSPSNVIFVATTNHIEKLDKAIIRDGRFDLTLNIGNICRSTAIRMCKSFNLSDDDTEEILKNNMEGGKINPAALQNLILQKIENYNN